jgi:predicted nucleic acid-binding protein
MMSERVFVDTNVLVYARDQRYPQKQEAAQAWLRFLAGQNLGVVSPQVLGEFHNAVLKGKIPVDPEEARRSTRSLESWSFGQTDLELVASAWSLRKRTGFQWWDCVILGSAIQAGCRFLLSEDYQHQRTIDSVTVLNPFACDPDWIAGKPRES